MKYRYDGNENGNYTIFENDRKYLELFAGEDEAINLVYLLNKYNNK